LVEEEKLAPAGDAALGPLFAGARELRIQFSSFEGPLDLLLHLIRKHELNIADIPIAFVTEEYLGYLDAMRTLDLGVAGEYLVMAATLLHIKSQSLVPRHEAIEQPRDDDAMEDDPRELLIRRLLQYQQYRDVAVRLSEREIIGRDVFTRPSRAEKLRDDAGPPDLMPLDLFHLLDVFRDLLKARPAVAMHEITPERMTLRDAIGRIAAHLDAHPRCSLLELLYVHGTEPGRLEIVITFLALLEMAKLRLVRLFQSALSTRDLMVERAVIEDVEQALRLDGLEEPG
jgi:segregation and condensation protein A